MKPVLAPRLSSLNGCPVINHLACKLPGELEPRTYDVFTSFSLASGVTLFNSFVDIGNRDAPFHLASLGYRNATGTGGHLSLRVYNSRGFGIHEDLLRAGSVSGGVNAPFPYMPSLVWPVNSSLIFDVTNVGSATDTFQLYFFGFKIYDRGKAPC
jgi:hypothetical protein